MMFTHVDCTPGEITYNDFDIEPNKPLEDQLWSLKEDMLQISFFESEFIIDIGWTNDFSIDGNFRLVVIEQMDWSNPIDKKETKSLIILEKYLKEAIVLVKLKLTDKAI
ncbi:hypothetical protein [Lysinibacillus fusiformis]|uniref:hypothetical protein n=1 Tax=Lysinibacillus fusiformis TaxID=28031 RepID=UPI0018E5D207|nr:hypothetical protein [Lysinibacillus fusiformis]MBI6865704.1 hypothetical protein [Lysinibacillus fusiformis]